MKIDYCPKCKTLNLIQIYANKFKCRACGYIETQPTLLNSKFKKTNTKLPNTHKRALIRKFAKVVK